MLIAHITLPVLRMACSRSLELFVVIDGNSGHILTRYFYEQTSKDGMVVLDF